MKKLYFGQIRPHNVSWLREFYGHAPPWPIDELPHVDFVQRVLNRADYMDGPYANYIRSTHAMNEAELAIRSKAAVIMSLSCSSHVPHVSVCLDSVLDGNHRLALSIVTGKPITVDEQLPRQTLRWPDGSMNSGRMPEDRLMDIDLAGLRVVELGSAEGMVSINALQHGAAHVTAVDKTMTATPWRLREAWGVTDRMDIVVADIEKMHVMDCDFVIAQSVAAHLSPSALRLWLTGRRCFVEMHSAVDPPPPTPHDWVTLPPSRYSALKEHEGLTRTVYLGFPKKGTTDAA